MNQQLQSPESTTAQHSALFAQLNQGADITKGSQDRREDKEEEEKQKEKERES